MSDARSAYADYLTHYADFLDGMCEQARMRYHALVSFDAAELNRAVAGLQSSLMQLDQMEARRMQMAEEAGFAQLSFRETLETLPEEERPPLEAILRRIEMSVSNVRFLNEKSMQLAKDGLNSLTPEMLGETKNLYAPPAFSKNRKSDTAAVFEAEY